jgi:hypothetical protein
VRKVARYSKQFAHGFLIFLLFLEYHFHQDNNMIHCFFLIVLTISFLYKYIFIQDVFKYILNYYECIYDLSQNMFFFF